MTWKTKSFVMVMRKLGRKLNINPLIAKLVYPEQYEKAFDEQMLSNIEVGDCVWDVGANIGFYTSKFSAAVGSKGRVVAFEPFASTFEILTDNCEDLANVVLSRYGLGASCETLQMELGGDDIGATNRITTSANMDGVCDIQVTTGDKFAEDEPELAPTVIKIDTEGHEFDIMKGCQRLLDSPTLRAVFIEVHFGLLERAGHNEAPRKIERKLEESGFEITWVDFSRLVAVRPSKS